VTAGSNAGGLSLTGGTPKRYAQIDSDQRLGDQDQGQLPSLPTISMNPALGDGGTCYGDSVGPNFLGGGSTETKIVAGTTITGDFMCRATKVDYRLDTPRHAHSSASTWRSASHCD
jgi:hypothetical protein